MQTVNDNMRIDNRDDQVVILGAVSVETKGLAGDGEPYGAIVLPGIAED
ncbi:benenodin family lasso peptide [Luteimonas granuli]|uniref:Benenodin family lasso peptide n=1 Tax=Luteimonas granuli TaxID=1176533 RepID=A0A518N6N9_9GAMM|nr:benenodin family lasso peptide [Luteimonas granuli]QDW67577.1 benenodin family lasso peptide [Luteimonas granuli]